MTSLATVAVVEWMNNATTLAELHSYVALSGVIGCGVACDISKRIQNMLIRATVLVLLPLMAVEGALRWQQDRFNEYQIVMVIHPHAATWLINFLMTTEQPSSTILSPFLPLWPRYLWLAYWAVIVLLALVCSPQTSSVVVVRKWFHFVAILLFLPVTLAGPQLMSLSYAIAICVLAVLENMRAFLPEVCQEFYTRYLDPQKDHDDIVVVSHMALILGCAMPLWIYECIDVHVSNETTPLLLPLFGILVLGVGDSLAALVGTSFGKNQWPSRNITRTLEGSAAMWLGMALCCWYGGISARTWLPAVTFTTLFEAFTTQIDNLVLPLAGAAVLLLTTTP